MVPTGCPYAQDLDAAVRRSIPQIQRRASEFGAGLAGADHDTVLDNFMSYAGAQTHRGIELLWDIPEIVTLDLRHALYSGFALAMGTRPHQDQARSSKPIQTQLNLRQASGGAFYLNQAQTFGCSFRNISIDGTTNNTLVEGHATNVLWTSVFRDISSQNGASVIGGPTSQKLLHTACTFDGAWNVNNVRNRGLRIGGSDTRLLFSQFLLDSGKDANGVQLLANNQFLMYLDAHQKAPITGMYVTCDGKSGLMIEYSANLTTITLSTFEGRNENTPCLGALIRAEGDYVYAITETFLGYAMTNPAATGRDDKGYVHCVGGSMRLDGIQFAPAASALYAGGVVPPLLYANGGRHIVENVQVRNGVAKPRVVLTNGATCKADSTVTVETV